mmetsp:Transcript_106771/g.185552  ORF Transcript_106771/g.185552 Transcript_106771/m.185552 type:complete len:326 (+) Transcript_106771:116-1093(+)
MDDARKLLDSLMGQTRDQALAEAKKTKGENFKAANVCKPYLLGFCPMSELAESKMAGKRNIKDCTKVHSEAMRDEFKSHPELAKFRSEYENQMLPMLEGMVREADAWVAREEANVKKVVGTSEKVTANNMPPSTKEQFEQLKQDMNKMMAAAENEAEKGNVEGSKFKVMLADEIKEKVKELEEKYIVTYDVTHRGEEVCDICGTRYEALTSSNHARYKAHFNGKVHVSYVKIRDWIKELKGKMRKGESGEAEKSDRGDRRDRDRDRRRRSRSAGKKDGDGEKASSNRESDRRRSRSRRENRERDRERDRDRGGDRDRDRDRGRRR